MEPEITNEDCMNLMSRYPDGFFDLAVVDPPYGIGIAKSGKVGGNNCGISKYYGKCEWDRKSPSEIYFKELLRVSKNQIIWGANHYISKFSLDSSCWIVWDKKTGGNFADCELAYTSFNTAVRKFTYTWNGFRQGPTCQVVENRIHPTQKPVQLYRWIFHNYAEPGQKILDTHLGSGSSRIAAHMEKMQFWACELDQDYFEAQEKRFKQHISQTTLF